MYSKQVNIELRETRNQVNNFYQRKHSDDTYADVQNIYDDPNLMRKSAAYETFDYQEVGDSDRYWVEPQSSKSQRDYLCMDSIKWLYRDQGLLSYRLKTFWNINHYLVDFCEFKIIMELNKCLKLILSRYFIIYV